MNIIRVTAILFVLILNGLQRLHSQGYCSADNFDVKFYSLDLTLSDTSSYLKGSAAIGIEILSLSDSVCFDLGSQLKVERVMHNGKESIFVHANDLLEVRGGFQPGKLDTIIVFYHGDGNDKEEFGALFNYNYASFGGFTFSLTEPYSAKYWFPCKQKLADKADSVFINISVPKHLKVGSNGLLMDVKEIDSVFHQFQWKSLYPTAYFLVSVAVGNYTDYSFKVELPYTENSLPVVNYIYNDSVYLRNNKPDIDTTAHLIRLFSELFGPYPFINEKYGHCLAPMGGGMEHQTMTTLSNFGFELVAHELAHQWFGNMVSCSQWNHIWIHEGFASYGEYLALEFSGYPDEAAQWLEDAMERSRQAQSGSVHVPEMEVHDASRIFNHQLSYKKGAVLVHMLRKELNNDTLFFDLLKVFLQTYAYKVASADDFKNLAEKMTGRSFDTFFQQWYYGSGYPFIEAEWQQCDEILKLRVQQTPSKGSGSEFFQFTLPCRISSEYGDTLVYLPVNAVQSEFEIDLKHTVQEIMLDPDHHFLIELGRIYSKTCTEP